MLVHEGHLFVIMACGGGVGGCLIRGGHLIEFLFKKYCNKKYKNTHDLIRNLSYIY